MTESSYSRHKRRLLESGEPKLYFVYALCDRSGVRYIGRATSLATRMVLHRGKTASRAMLDWRREGPVRLEVLHVVDCERAVRQLEAAEIARHQRRGARLLNKHAHDAGDAKLGPRRVLGKCRYGSAREIEQLLRDRWKRRHGRCVDTAAGVRRFVRQGEDVEAARRSGWWALDWGDRPLAGPTTYDAARRAGQRSGDSYCLHFSPDGAAPEA